MLAKIDLYVQRYRPLNSRTIYSPGITGDTSTTRNGNSGKRSGNHCRGIFGLEVFAHRIVGLSLSDG